MSNKGLTFIIILLLVLCAITFGAFYLKVHPEMALSQKLFGTKVVAPVSNPAAPLPEDITPTFNGDNTNSSETNPILVTNIVPPVSVETNTTVPIVPTAPVDTPLEQPVESKTEVKQVPVESTKTTLTQTLKKGSKGAEVKALQEFLVANDYLNGSIDGIFGSKTESAVKAFQTEYKLKVDGIVGGTTRSTINEMLSSE